MKKKIIIGFWGGLGNQFFTYALGRVLSLKFNAEFIIDKSFYKTSQNQRLSQFKINNFNIPKDIVITEDFNNFFFNFLKVYNFLSKKKKIKKNFLNLIYQKNLDMICLEKKFEFDKNILNLNKGNTIYYHGYWQSHFYFNDIKDILSNDLIPNDNNNLKLEKIKKNISENTIAIHFRGTDYIDHPMFHQIQKSHYINSIEYFKKLIKDPIFHIFTDDIKYSKEYAKIIFRNNEKVYFIHEDFFTDIEEFYLMRHYSKYIIPHSTFSWWAAYLSFSKNKHVILPQYWFKNQKTKEDYIAENMRII